MLDGARSTINQKPEAHAQEAELAKQLTAAKAEVGKIKKEAETERGRVKRAMAEMKKKLDGWVWPVTFFTLNRGTPMHPIPSGTA